MIYLFVGILLFYMVFMFTEVLPSLFGIRTENEVVRLKILLSYLMYAKNYGEDLLSELFRSYQEYGITINEFSVSRCGVRYNGIINGTAFNFDGINRMTCIFRVRHGIGSNMILEYSGNGEFNIINFNKRY